MSYKNTRGRVPTGRSEATAKPRPPDPKGTHRTASRRGPSATANTHPDSTKPHKPYSVCPPMNSLMIDVGGIAAISSGESATM